MKLMASNENEQKKIKWRIWKIKEKRHWRWAAPPTSMIVTATMSQSLDDNWMSFSSLSLKCFWCCPNTFRITHARFKLIPRKGVSRSLQYGADASVQKSYARGVLWWLNNIPKVGRTYSLALLLFSPLVTKFAARSYTNCKRNSYIFIRNNASAWWEHAKPVARAQCNCIVKCRCEKVDFSLRSNVMLWRGVYIAALIQFQPIIRILSVHGRIVCGYEPWSRHSPRGNGGTALTL